MDFAKNPIITDDNVESFRQKLIIVEKYSPYYPKIKNINAEFTK